MHLDVESVQAALLHDVVEDTFITSKMLEDEFGPTVNEIVEALPNWINCASMTTKKLKWRTLER